MNIKHEANGNGDAIKRISSVTSMILGLSAVISLVVYLYGAQVFASKSELEKIKECYVTKELFVAKMEVFDEKLTAVLAAIKRNRAEYPRP